MKSTGIVRRVDELGRIVLPKELRKTLNIEPNSSMEIFTDDKAVVLRKYEPADIFTGNMEDLVDYHGKKVSRNSIVELCNLAGIKILE